MKKKHVILLDSILAALALLAGKVTGWMIALIPDCPVTKYGLLCPACGGTRCVRYFFSGQWGAAFRINPFFFILIWYLAVAWMMLNVGILLNIPIAKKVAGTMLHWRTVIIAAVLFAVFGIVRNIV